MKFKAFFISLFILFFSVTSFAQLGTIQGPTSVFYGNQVTYTFQNDYGVSSGNWEVTNGNILWEDSNPSIFWYQVTVYWGGSGTGTVKFKDGSWPLDYINVTIVPEPSAPTSVTNGSRCSAGNVNLSATPGANATTVKWYNVPTGGSVLSTGTSYSPYVSSTTTFYASSYHTTQGRESNLRTSVTATINPIPSLPSPNSFANCGPGQVFLSATPGANANAIRWFDSEQAYVSTNPSYVTPTLSSTVTYYLSSYNSTTGCESGLASVQATIAQIPNAPIGFTAGICGSGTIQLGAGSGAYGNTVRWYDSPTGGTLLATGAPFTTPVLSASTVYFISSYNSDNGCESTSSRIPVTASVNAVPSAPSVTNGQRCGAGLVGLGAAPGANGDDVKWYSTPTGASLVSTGFFYQPNISTTTTFYVSTLNNNGYCEGTSRVPVTATVTPVPDVPVSVTPASICGSGSVTLTAGYGNNGNTIRWYPTLTGGTAVATATTYSPSISSTTTYYVVSYNTVTGCESTGNRTSVTATVHPLPASVAHVTGGSRCGSGVVNLSATPGGNANSVQWYTASSGGTLLNTGTSYSPALSATTTFYVASYNSTNGCISAARVAVVATLTDLAVPLATGGNICGTGFVTVSATPGSGGNAIRWYSTATGGSLITTSNSYTTTISSTVNFYAATYNTVTGCESSVRAVATAISFTLPSAPIITGNSRWGQGVVQLSASGGSNYRWYSPSGTLLASSANFTTEILLASQTNFLYVRTFDGTCESAPTWVSISVEVPIITATPSDRTVMGSLVTLATQPYATYLWKNSGGTVLGTGTTFVTNIPGWYTVTVTKTGVSGNAESVPFKIKGQHEQLDLNFIVSNKVMVKGKKSIGELTLLPVDSVNQSIQYFDGIGRLIQTVATRESPGREDKVIPIQYDLAGREAAKYLPYAHGNDGLLKDNWTTDLPIFYQTTEKVAHDDRPYSTTVFEASPLERSWKLYGPGKDWFDQGKYIQTDIVSNVHGTASGQERIITWEVNPSGMPVRYASQNSGYYPSGSLFVKVSTDERDFQVREYSTKEGTLVLKKVQAAEGPVELNNSEHWAQTYYVYDYAKKLRFTFQPELSKTLSNSTTSNPSTTQMDNLAFQYKYDRRGRMKYKKVPGTDWIYMVYDKRDRLILTQDGVQRSGESSAIKYWTFTKYDQLNRPIMTGIKDTTTSVQLTQEQMQSAVDAHFAKSASNWSEVYVGSVVNNVHGYTNKAYPVRTGSISTEVDPSKYLTVTYYDNYQRVDDMLGTTDYNFTPADLDGQEGSANTHVLRQVTSSKVRSLSSGAWMNTIYYYDDKYRSIQTISDNAVGGIDRMTNVVDFTGKVTATKTVHTKSTLHWKDIVGVQTLGNQELVKIGTEGWGTGGAASLEMLPSNTDGWIEFSASELNTYRMIGFSTSNEDANYGTLNYSLYQALDRFQVWENANYRGVDIPLVLGDVLRVERRGSQIGYYKNGILIFNSEFPTNEALLVDAALYSQGGTIKNIRTSFSNDSHNITRTFSYDHTGRLLTTHHSIDGSTAILIAKNEYNELGQLINKNLHSTNGITFKQSTDYRNNIRGWLTSINNAELSPSTTNEDDGNMGRDLFGMELAYEKPVTGLTATGDLQYNGNISALTYSNNLALGAIKSNGYKFDYDPMNRLTESNFRQKKLGTWNLSEYEITNSQNQAQIVQQEAFSETGFDYDMNGNIKALQRSGTAGSQKMDDLGYVYEGNQLMSVGEKNGADKEKGFIDGNVSGDDYRYDANGNMIADANKSIASIAYNHLNLPEKVTKASGEYIQYHYDATGRKLSQQVYDPSYGLVKKSDYAGEYFYENDTLKFINHEEGRVVLNWDYNPPELVASFNGSNPSEFILNAGIPGTLSSEQLAGQTYLKFTNATFHWAGPLTNSVAVQAGETYKLNIQGYTTNSDVYVYIMGGDGSDVLWPGANFPLGASRESWMENTFTVPAGMDHVYLGVIFGDAHPTSEDAFYINSMALYKMTNLGTTTTNEYQYHLKDHLGNVRTTFTTKEEIEETIATLERKFENTERSEYIKYDDARRVFDHLFDHTNGLKPSVIPGHSIRLNGSPEERNGIAKSFSVMPGDKIDMQVFGKYFDSTTPHIDQTAWNALVGFITMVHEAAQTVVIDGVGYTSGVLRIPPYTGVITDPDESALFPKAHLNWVVFDRGWKFLDGGAKQLKGGAEDGTDVAFGEITNSIDVKEPGYVYVWLSNTSTTEIDVYFDDFKVTHNKSPVIQQDEYYPLGLTFNSYKRENITENRYLYNQGAGEKVFMTERVYDLGLNVDQSKYRTYDYITGRWLQVDPKADKGGQESWSPYQYSFNNPIRNNDPEGDICIPCITAGVGFVVGATLNAVDQYQSGTLDGSWKSVSRILVAGAGGAIAGSGYGGVAAGAGVAAAAEAIDQKISTGQVNNITKVVAAGMSSAAVGVALKGVTALAVKAGLVNLTTAGAKALGKTTFVAGAKGVTAQGYTTSTGRAVEGAVVAVSKAAVEGANGVASYAAGNFGTKVWPTLTSTSTVVPIPPLIQPAVSN